MYFSVAQNRAVQIANRWHFVAAVVSRVPTTTRSRKCTGVCCSVRCCCRAPAAPPPATWAPMEGIEISPAESPPESVYLILQKYKLNDRPGMKLCIALQVRPPQRQALNSRGECLSDISHLTLALHGAPLGISRISRRVSI